MFEQCMLVDVSCLQKAKCVGCDGNDGWVGHRRDELCVQCSKAFADQACRRCDRLRLDPDECDEDGFCDECHDVDDSKPNDESNSAQSNNSAQSVDDAKTPVAQVSSAQETMCLNKFDNESCGCYHNGPMEPTLCAFHLEKMDYE